MSDPEIRRRLQAIAQERAQLEGAGFGSFVKKANKGLKDSKILSTAAALSGNPMYATALGATGYGVGSCVDDMQGGYYKLRKDGSWSHKKSAATKGRKEYTKADGTIVPAVSGHSKGFRLTKYDPNEIEYADEDRGERIRKEWRPEFHQFPAGTKIHEPNAPSDWNDFVSDNYDDVREIVDDHSGPITGSEANRRTIILLGQEYRRQNPSKVKKGAVYADASFARNWFN